MMMTIRVLLARFLIASGMAILPKGVRKMVRGLMLYHVPGAMTDDERAEVRAAKTDWLRAKS